MGSYIIFGMVTRCDMNMHMMNSVSNGHIFWMLVLLFVFFGSSGILQTTKSVRLYLPTKRFI
jgi:hypothetical protein